MYRIYFFLWLVFLYSPQVSGQYIDSLKLVLPEAPDTVKAAILQKIAFKIVRDKPDSAIFYFTESQKIANEYNLNELEVEALSGIAFGYEILQDSANVNTYYTQAINVANGYGLKDKQSKQHIYFGNYLNMTSNVLLAINQYTKALKLFKESKDTLNIIDTNSRISNAYNSHGDYVAALQINLKTFDVAKAYKDTVGIANLINNTAIIYKKQNKVDEALRYYQQAINLLINTKYKDQIATATCNIALIYKDRNKLDTALVLMHQTLSHFEKKDSKFSIALMQHNIAMVHQKDKKVDSTKYYLEKSQHLCLKFGFEKIRIQNLLAFAELYQDLDKPQAAILQTDQAIIISKKLGSLEDLRNIYKTRNQIFEKQNNIQEAYTNLKQFQSISDSIFNDNKKQQINFLKSQAELKQKEQELVMVAKEAEIERLYKENAKNWNYLLIIGLVALIIISILLLLSRNNKAKANLLLQQKSDKVATQHAKIEKQRKKLLKKNKRLKKLNDDKNQLIGVVAHDLRSPLNQIRGLINILKLTDNLSNNGNEIVGKIAISTDRLKEMINRTLDLKAIETNKINLKHETFDLIQLISSVVDNFVDLAAEKSIRMEKQLFMEDCVIKADKNYTIQIMENLISNAIKFSPYEGLVAINIQTAGLKLIISVSDTGPGIMKKDKKKLFKPYQKLTAKPTNNEDSSGLGLAIVKKYVEAMGGMVNYSDNPGGGACFTVTFVREAVIDAISA